MVKRMNYANKQVSQSHPPFPVHTTSNDAKYWLDSLPLINYEKTAKLLIYAIGAVKFAQLSTSERIKKFELIHPFVNRISETLYDQYLHDSSSDFTRKRPGVLLAKKLHILLSNGYLAAINDGQLGNSDPLVITALHRALHHCGKAHLRCYQLYTNVDSNLWKLAYKLYRYAADNQLLKKKVADFVNEKHYSSTLNSKFKFILFLSIAGTYQLSSRDIELISEVYPSWSQHITINSNINEQHLYVFNLNAASGPVYREFYQEPDDAELIGINLHKMLDYLQQLMSLAGSKHALLPSVAKSRYLLEHLCKAWSGIPSRRFPRINKAGKMSVCIGLGCAHFYMQKLNDSEHGINKLNKNAFDPLKSPYFEDKVFAEIFSDVIAKQFSDKSKLYTMHSWTLVNSSEDGFCLCTSLDAYKHIKPGQIISVELPPNPEKKGWFLGVVRWVRFEGDQLYLGLQLLTDSFVPVLVQNKAQAANRQSLGGFLINESGKRQAILLAPLPYKLQDVITVTNNKRIDNVNLSQLLESSSYYQLYACSPVSILSK